MVIVVVGMPGSGKDILVQSAKTQGYAHVRMGNVVRAFADKAGLPQDDRSIGGFANEQRRVHGDAVWALRTLDRMPGGDAVIDGSRSLAEIEEFKRVFGEALVVIGIKTTAEQRFQRLRARGREDDPKTQVEFNARDRRELSWGILEALENADLILKNDKGLEEFRQKCQDILDNIKRKHGKSI